MKGDVLLFITYFLAKERDLKDFHLQYLKRVEKARDITEVLFVTDRIRGERNDVLLEVMMQDFRRDAKVLGNFPFDESEWGLYSLSCVAVDVAEPASKGASVSRLWWDLALDEERVPRTYTSKVQGLDLSRSGRGSTLGEFSF